MNYERIESLLNKYFDGATSLAEERELRDFFSGHDIPANLSIYSPLFRYHSESARDKIQDTDFDEKLLSRLTEEKPILRKTNRRSINWYYITAVAACIILLFTVFLPADKNPVMHLFSSKVGDTFSDPEKAYKETVKALLLVSSKLNTGTGKMKGLSKFEEGVDNVASLSKMESGRQDIAKLDNINKGLKEMAKISKITDNSQNN
ncbi:MAG: hypothetical protein NT175_13720 [Bacteroidetes bacterium]|nr:hypothetical protein [Bacteroidota bacterium]